MTLERAIRLKPYRRIDPAREILGKARSVTGCPFAASMINTCCGDSFPNTADGRLSRRRGSSSRRPMRSLAARRLDGKAGSASSWLDMWSTCAHAEHMSKMVQIRNVPDALHRKLKARAAAAGQSLSDYLLAEIGRIAALPTREEMLARLHSRTRVTLKTPAAVVIREERESA